MLYSVVFYYLMALAVRSFGILLEKGLEKGDYFLYKVRMGIISPTGDEMMSRSIRLINNE
jgi:hypothetical protein